MMKVPAYIYGAGDNGIALADILTDCQFDVRAFIDRDEKKWGVCEVGENKTQIQCLGIEDALEKGAAKELVFVTVKYDSDQVKEYLSGKGFEKIVIGNNYRNVPISHIMKHFLPEPSEMGSWEGCYPFGRYDSAYPSLRSLGKEPSTDREILGIDFNLARQAELVSQMEEIKLPGWSNEIGHGGYRYHYENGWFDKSCADALYYFMRILEPKKIIEIGSGYSTAVMLDTNEIFFDDAIEIISIEPNAGRLKSLLKEKDNILIEERDVQSIPVDFFGQLNENDILFVDSSHVSKYGSDVNYILFEILPRLKKGVYIHFHDIFHSFEYPMMFLYQRRAYNEAYLLRAFLMYNKAYSIQLFGDMLEHDKKIKAYGQYSLWIRKE